ncbi:zinc-dependent alcohol dehydrogenase [Polymorphospora rubra]|uniref:Alcohol dehydrogenase n=1 Tax=Polymorphospora rubra TaxID=338584 RepID=A0A810N1P9_9ACTN|nr:alcohol dehydrogenase catalytic domain-containing protein [Polymorphospora rubra]BCJ67362.1 alcohol dehydrogenase [Polymorphospora rubra]
MKALVLQDDRSLRLTHRRRPEVTAPDDVVVRVAQTGFCGTDRGVLLGRFPAAPGVVMGHEAVGEVVEVGAGVTTLRPGDRVAANPTLYCGLCSWCRRGALNFCLHKAGNEIGIDRDGAFAEYLRLEERFLHPLPSGMSYDRAVLVEPLACVMNNLEAARLRTADEVVVLGGGPIGVLVALLADHAGARARLAEPDPYRRAAAQSYFAGIPGCAVTVTEPDRIAARSASLVVDTVGALLDRACDIADNLGRVVVMGFHDKATAILRPLDVLQRGLTVIGAGDYNSLIFVRAVELARHLPLEGIVTHHVRLDDFTDALDTLGIAPGAPRPYTGMKVVITTGGGR